MTTSGIGAVDASHVRPEDDGHSAALPAAPDGQPRFLRNDQPRAERRRPRLPHGAARGPSRSFTNSATTEGRVPDRHPSQGQRRQPLRSRGERWRHRSTERSIGSTPTAHFSGAPQLRRHGRLLSRSRTDPGVGRLLLRHDRKRRRVRSRARCFGWTAAGNVVTLHDFDGTGSGPAGGARTARPDRSIPTAALVEGADGVALRRPRERWRQPGHGIVFRYTIAAAGAALLPERLRAARPDGGVPPEDRARRRPHCRPTARDLPRRRLSLALRRLDRGARVRRHHRRLRRRRLLPALAGHPRADGGLSPQDGARRRLHAAGLHRRLPGRALRLAVRRLDRGASRPKA